MLLFVTVDFDCSLLATRFYLFDNVYNSSISLYLKVGDSMKIPRDLTEASLSGAGLSIIAALSMLFLFGMVGPDLRPTGSEFHSMLVIHSLKHGEEADDDSVEGSHTLTANNFDSYSHEYPILAVNFYDPWCYWSKCLVFLFSPFVSQILSCCFLIIVV
ncbi:hypothetical protein WN943_015491 [Citrus x changshan-huyou]